MDCWARRFALRPRSGGRAATRGGGRPTLHPQAGAVSGPAVGDAPSDTASSPMIWSRPGRGSGTGSPGRARLDGSRRCSPGGAGSTGGPARRKRDVDLRRSRGPTTPPTSQAEWEHPRARTPDQAALISQPDRPSSLLAGALLGGGRCSAIAVGDRLGYRMFRFGLPEDEGDRVPSLCVWTM
jgi:hypothetical protein